MLLDTNVVSEVMRPRPDAIVVEWLDTAATRPLWISSVTIAEVVYGLELIPDGARRSRLERGFVSFLERGFAGRVLSFDADAAAVYGRVSAHRRNIGRPISVLDAQIAAIARSRGLAVATRNVRDFDDCGVEVIDPFAS